MNFRTILLLTPALSFLYFSLPNDVCAQSSSRLLSHNNRAYELCLVARNKGREFIYRRGKPVRIEIKEDGKRRLVIKGLITRFEKDAMIIGSFKKNAITGFDTIKPGEIEKIRMLSRPQRKFSAMALAGAVAYSGTMLLLIEETGPLSYVLFIPAFGVGLIFMYYYPATFLYDLLREHQEKKGWQFSIQPH